MSLRQRAWAEIDLAAIEHNVRSVRGFLGPNLETMAVVKADAYGHGSIPVVKAAIRAGCRWIGVASVQEGAQLRSSNIDTPIAILAPCAPGDAGHIIELGLTAMVGDFEIVKALASHRRDCHSVSVHLDIDTGMGRSGVLPHQAVELHSLAIELGLHVSGITTHYSDADGNDFTVTSRQRHEFQQALMQLTSAGARFDWIHTSNSAATIGKVDSMSNLFRPGLLVYGICPAVLSPSEAAQRLETTLKPALALYATIASVRSLPAGHTIGYGATCVLKRKSRVATVTIGYGDGYPRTLSNSGWMIVRGVRAPVLGRVSMDQTVVDVTEIAEVCAGDTAVCIGTQGSASIEVKELAQLGGVIDHEITTGLTSRIPRIYEGGNAEEFNE